MRQGSSAIPLFEGVFFDPAQRAANAIHELSYRACFKPSVPSFFIQRLTNPGDVVCDPFLGRGTTAVQASLLGRQAWGSDVNPLASMLCLPRLHPPTVDDVAERLAEIDLSWDGDIDDRMLAFFHRRTLREICALREYLLARASTGALDEVDAWIRMVAANRLTGHSVGFFSRYTLPPNQAASIEAQQRINLKIGKRSEYRQIIPRILTKTASLLSDGVTPCCGSSIHVASADDLHWAAPSSVSLVFCSPPFLDVVDYQSDNWLRNWFCGVGEASVKKIWNLADPVQWTEAMCRFLAEAKRIVVPGGWIGIEVGDVRGGRVQLDELLVGAGKSVGLEVVLVLVNSVGFTRTAHIWNVRNGVTGTNTNRVVLMRRP